MRTQKTSKSAGLYGSLVSNRPPLIRKRTVRAVFYCLTATWLGLLAATVYIAFWGLA